MTFVQLSFNLIFKNGRSLEIKCLGSFDAYQLSKSLELCNMLGRSPVTILVQVMILCFSAPNAVKDKPSVWPKQEFCSHSLPKLYSLVFLESYEHPINDDCAQGSAREVREAIAYGSCFSTLLSCS